MSESFSVGNPIPHYVVAGETRTLELNLEREGNVVPASSAALKVLDTTGATLFTAGSVTTPGGVPTAALTATETELLQFTRQPYRAVWTVDGEPLTMELYRVREVYRPSITVGQLVARKRILLSQVKDGATGVQGYIDQVAIEFEQRLLGNDKRAFLVWDRHSLVRWEREFAYYLIYSDLRSYNPELELAYSADADKAESNEQKLWSTINFRYDQDQDGTHERHERTSARGPLLLGGHGGRRRW